MAPPRRFDHDEAVARHAARETIQALAAEYGVTTNGMALAIRRLTEPGFREAENAAKRAWETGECETCDRYAEQFPPATVDKQTEMAKQMWPCCGEHRDGPHHTACAKYVEPAPTVHEDQESLL